MGLVSYNIVVLETGRGSVRSTVPVNSLNVWNCKKRSVHQKKIRTGSLYCAGPNDHQITSNFVKLCITLPHIFLSEFNLRENRAL